MKYVLLKQNYKESNMYGLAGYTKVGLYPFFFNMLFLLNSLGVFDKEVYR